MRYSKKAKNVLVTTKTDGNTYTPLMSKKLEELYRSPQCDPMTRNASADAIRAQNAWNESPCISNERPCTSDETPVENESPCSSSGSSFSIQESTIASSSTSEQADHDFWPNVEQHQFYPERNLDIFRLIT